MKLCYSYSLVGYIVIAMHKQRLRKWDGGAMVGHGRAKWADREDRRIAEEACELRGCSQKSLAALAIDTSLDVRSLPDVVRK